MELFLAKCSRSLEVSCCTSRRAQHISEETRFDATGTTCGRNPRDGDRVEFLEEQKPPLAVGNLRISWFARNRACNNKTKTSHQHSVPVSIKSKRRYRSSTLHYIRAHPFKSLHYSKNREPWMHTTDEHLKQTSQVNKQVKSREFLHSTFADSTTAVAAYSSALSLNSERPRPKVVHKEIISTVHHLYEPSQYRPSEYQRICCWRPSY